MGDYGINKGFAGDFYAWHRLGQHQREWISMKDAA